ncbi:yippee-domain-containing protein [Rhizodiscina lignyota]|uniref:Yippee-domain-containing protein n=1 Tax=Rhizodiscina lignyota TaxID=1504668 RepID=A0A9P4M8U1_9PEZI|nr:yippee-domain-containing protein [Rhizodiscina lignyota]
MHFTNPLSSSPPSLLFPTYLLPSVPFRRRKSSADSTGTVTSTTSASPTGPSFLHGASSHLQCAHCLADLCPTSSIISKGFTGRHGRAYLVAPPSTSERLWIRHSRDVGNLPNTTLDKAVPRQLVTGAHTVADIRCKICDSVLGWKYVAAEDESQRYKVGKFILETKRVCRAACWESGLSDSGYTALDEGAEDEIEFDSQDEDECEDLFAGVWSPGLAKKRRERKQIWRQDADLDMV